MLICKRGVLPFIVPELVVKPTPSARVHGLGAHDASRLGLPSRVVTWQAHGAGTEEGGSRGLGVEKEDAVGDIASPRDGTQRGGAIETAIDATAAVTT